jgi:hypothetical protein
MCSVLYLQQVSAQFWSLLWQSHSRTLNMSSHSICYSHEVSPFLICFQCSYQSSVYTNSLLAMLNVRKAVGTSSEGDLRVAQRSRARLHTACRAVREPLWGGVPDRPEAGPGEEMGGTEDSEWQRLKCSIVELCRHKMGHVQTEDIQFHAPDGKEMLIVL